MKKFKILMLILAASLFFEQTASAQFYFGGSIRGNMAFNKDDSSNFDFAPEIGYSIGKWSVGLGMSIYGSFATASSPGTSNFNFNPYVDYYLLEAGPLSLFVEGGVEFIILNNGIDPSRRYLKPYILPAMQLEIVGPLSALTRLGKLQYDPESNSLGLSLSGDAISIGLQYSF